MQKIILCCICLIFIFSTFPISFAQQVYIPLNESTENNGIIFLIFNFSLLIIIILFLKNKIPSSIKNKFKKIYSFELSKRKTILIMCIIFSAYIIISINELDDNEEYFSDSKGVFDAAKTFDILEVGLTHAVIKYYLLNLSIELFDNIRIIPFIASNLVLVISYLITKEITKKRFAGIISILVILQSSLFLKYDTTATYDNFCVLFYFISIYLIIKLPYLSSFVFIFSVLSKGLTVLFLPFTLFFISRSEISKNKKIFSYISYIIIIIIGLIATTTNRFTDILHEFSSREFVTGFKQFSMFLSNDLFIIIAILPLTIGLFFISRKGNRYADPLQIMIAGILLVAPILMSFTTLSNHDYRMIPLVIAFAIGIGTLFSNVHLVHIKKSDKYISTIVFVITVSIVGINILSVVFPDLIKRRFFLELFI